MSMESRVETFIRIVEEMLEAERELRRDQQANQHEEDADRFIQAFPTKRDDAGDDLERVLGLGLSTGRTRDWHSPD